MTDNRKRNLKMLLYLQIFFNQSYVIGLQTPDTCLPAEALKAKAGHRNPVSVLG